MLKISVKLYTNENFQEFLFNKLGISEHLNPIKRLDNIERFFIALGFSGIFEFYNFEDHFNFYSREDIALSTFEEAGRIFINNFGGDQINFVTFNEDLKEYKEIIYCNNGQIHCMSYTGQLFYERYNIFFGEPYYPYHYVKSKNDKKYYRSNAYDVFRVGYSYYHYNFNKQDLELAKFLHRIFKMNFDNLLIENTQDVLFLQQAIGYYKPIWDDENADEDDFETDHEYVFCDTF